MKTYFRVLSFAKPYTKRLLVAAFFMLVVSSCGAATMYLLKPLFDQGFLNTNATAAFQVTLNIALALVGITFVNGIAFYIKDYLYNNAGQRIIMDIRNEVYDHVQNLSLSYFSKNKTGQTLSRLTIDVVNMQNAVASLAGIFDNATKFLGYLIIVIFMDWKLGLIALGVAGLIAYPVYTFGRRLRHISIDTQNKIGDISSIAYEGISNIRIVKAFAMEKYEHDKLILTWNVW